MKCHVSIRLTVYLTLTGGAVAPVSAQMDTAWVRTWDAPAGVHAYLRGLRIGSDNDVFVVGDLVERGGAGDTVDIVILNYDSTGALHWARTLDTPGDFDDRAGAVAVDGSGRLAVTGGTVVTASHLIGDMITSLYERNGDNSWTDWFDGPSNNQARAEGVVADDAGNVYIVGAS